MKTRSPSRLETLRTISSARRRHATSERIGKRTHLPVDTGTFYPFTHEVRVICLYPSVAAGKLARQWLETALRSAEPHSSAVVEYFNYTVLDNDGICWDRVLERLHPDIIMMVGDGKHTLGGGLRRSLRELLSKERNTKSPLVIFRDLEPQPTLNTRVLLDYVSALTSHAHGELNAMNANGHPISCFRHPQLLLQSRRHQE